MDVEGYLPAAIVFNFPSVLSFSYFVPYYELLEALEESERVEVDAVNECLRVKGVCVDEENNGEEEYKKWLLPNGDGTFGCPKWIKEPMPLVEPVVVEPENVQVKEEDAAAKADEGDNAADAGADAVVSEAESKVLSAHEHVEEKKEDIVEQAVSGHQQ